MEWEIDGVKRQALVYIPQNAKTQVTPLVFAFHGHGGTMQAAYKGRPFDKLWAEAISVFPQGLNTPGMITDPLGVRAGWIIKDTTSNNRDLKFFDVMLQSLEKDFKIDKQRIYATGHSNGGAFVYFLWATRPQVFAAFAPTAASVNKYIKITEPKPAFHLMGEKDLIVRPMLQKFSFNKLIELNECSEKPYKIEGNISYYKGKNGNDLEFYIHSGGHTYPEEANVSIINFFKDYIKPN